MKYSEYLRSEHWLQTRNLALQRAGYRCQLCGSDRELQVHHNSYQNLGNEADRDLIVLCDRCHTRHSEALEIPPTVVLTNTKIGEWYPNDRAGEIIRQLETETNWTVVRALLAEKMSIDRGRT